MDDALPLRRGDLVTIKDVAREAGVSTATVSRVWNGRQLVSDDTRRRVLAVAQRLGYTPNGAARSLITSRTSTLGVLLPDLHGEFFSEVIRGIDQTARAHRYHLLVSSFHARALDMRAALRSMWGRVDALAIMSPDLHAGVAIRAIPPQFPAVLLGSTGNSSGFDSIAIDNAGGARAMVAHLIANGHRRIAAIAGPRRNRDAAERLRGYHAAMRTAGLDVTPEVVVDGDFSEGAGHRAAGALLALHPRPTAIFATNDSMAIGALSALHRAGCRVPGDIAVAGFDDIPMASYMAPPLTTVHVDISTLGERATRRLLDRMAGTLTGEPVHEMLPTHLVIRESCGGR